MTYHQETQNFRKKYYKLTDEEIEKILSQLPNKRWAQFINRKLFLTTQNPSENLSQKTVIDDTKRWVECYNTLRGVDWPDCNTIDDFKTLSIEIQDECISIHKFSPQHWTTSNYQEWQETTSWSYEIHELLRLKYLILDNLEFIENKNIIDFASHIGVISNICLFNGATSVLATEVREAPIKINQEGADILGFSDQFSVVQADIHDYSRNTELCKNKDTVLLPGIMYHVHDHWNILESITASNPKTIIIETKENKNILKLEDPLIAWDSEPSNNLLSGYHKDMPTVWVGYPNESWFNKSLEILGYVQAKPTVYYKFYEQIGTEVTAPSIQDRSVQVYSRKN